MGEREDHIATVETSAPRRNYSRFMEKGSNGDGDESGGNSPSRQGAGVASPGSPDLETAAAEQRGFREKGFLSRGF